MTPSTSILKASKLGYLRIIFSCSLFRRMLTDKLSKITSTNNTTALYTYLEVCLSSLALPSALGILLFTHVVNALTSI